MYGIKKEDAGKIQKTRKIWIIYSDTRKRINKMQIGKTPTNWTIYCNRLKYETGRIEYRLAHKFFKDAIAWVKTLTPEQRIGLKNYYETQNLKGRNQS